jgi:hypothetical protein
VVDVNRLRELELFGLCGGLRTPDNCFAFIRGPGAPSDLTSHSIHWAGADATQVTVAVRNATWRLQRGGRLRR